MRIDSKWHFVGALILAGLLSLYASFAGLMAFAWDGFAKQRFPFMEILLFLPPLLALPLFALSAASSRLASFALWALGPTHSLAMFQLNANLFAGSFLHYLGLLLDCMFDRVAIMLWATAWLVHFGTGIYNRPRLAEQPAPIET